MDPIRRLAILSSWALASSAPGRLGSSRVGDRTSSAKYIVSRASTSLSGRIATRYSLLRMTNVAMATLPDFLHRLAEEGVGLAPGGRPRAPGSTWC